MRSSVPPALSVYGFSRPSKSSNQITAGSAACGWFGCGTTDSIRNGASACASATMTNDNTSANIFMRFPARCRNDVKGTLPWGRSRLQRSRGQLHLAHEGIA